MSLREVFWPLLGNWTGVERLASGQSARAMIVFKLDVHDRVVTQDYRQVREGGEEFSGHGVFILDNDSNDGLMWWFFDSTGRPPGPAPGSWANGELILLADGAEHRFAVVNDQLRYRISTPDTEELLGNYRRISGH